MVATAAGKSCAEDKLDDNLDCEVGAGIDALAGAALLATGVAVLIYNEARPTGRDPEGVARPAAAIEHHYVDGAIEIEEPATADPALRNLTVQASVAARAGQCAAVRSIATRVANRDRSYRRDGFVRDQRIVRCLEP